MRKGILITLLLSSIITCKSVALNVTIINSGFYTMDVRWDSICKSMGHTATIYPDSKLDLLSNLSTTDILIVTSALDTSISAFHTNIIRQYLQNGGKVYLQTEYDATFPGNVAYASLVNSLGGYFKWTGTVSGTLAPMTILGSMATDYAVTSPLPYFWYGQSIDSCSSVESFLQYNGQYFGCIFCVPSSAGRLITASDQDWVQQSANYPASDSLMKNIISNLAKTSYSCVSSGNATKISLGNDTSFCAGNFVILTPGPGYSSYLWNDGETTSSIFVTSTGVYSVSVNSSCATGKDTINVTVFPSPPTPSIVLSNDTLFCSFDTSYAAYQWYADTALIHGATNPYLVISSGGNYNLQVVAHNGCSIAVGITITGVKTFFSQHTFTVSPNPVADKLYIGNYPPGTGMIVIYNALGQVVLSHAGASGQGFAGDSRSEGIDVSNLSSGVYFLKAVTGNGMWAGKFIKE